MYVNLSEGFSFRTTKPVTPCDGVTRFEKGPPSVPCFLLQYGYCMAKPITYLASDLVTVYSNHKMLGIRLVSRTRKYSEIGLSFMTKDKRKSYETSCTQLFRLRMNCFPL